jgi:hypothetical protein
MSGIYFQVGDRVRVRASTFLRVGMRGTIVRSFSGEDDLYDVQVDDAVRPYLMLASELERSNDTVPSGLRMRRVGALRTNPSPAI